MTHINKAWWLGKLFIVAWKDKFSDCPNCLGSGHVTMSQSELRTVPRRDGMGREAIRAEIIY
jgi:hypothetical protein